MQKYNLNDLIEYDDTKFRPKVLINEPGYRMVLLGLRAGQSIPEHANIGRVTVQVISGHITFYEEAVPCELRAGEILSIESGSRHRLEAHEDSAVFVLATGTATAPAKEPQELYLRHVPRPERHPLVFAKLDALAVGESFILINDHDPIPLNRQIEDRRPGEISWEYASREPGLYRIRIKRISSPETARILAEA